jgi:hypothetical protein
VSDALTNPTNVTVEVARGRPSHRTHHHGRHRCGARGSAQWPSMRGRLGGSAANSQCPRPHALLVSQHQSWRPGGRATAPDPRRRIERAVGGRCGCPGTLSRTKRSQRLWIRARVSRFGDGRG